MYTIAPMCAIGPGARNDHAWVCGVGQSGPERRLHKWPALQVLWELYTGCKAWGGVGGKEELRKIVGEDAQTLDMSRRGINDAVHPIIQDCFVFTPVHRPGFSTIVQQLRPLFE